MRGDGFLPAQRGGTRTRGRGHRDRRRSRWNGCRIRSGQDPRSVWYRRAGSRYGRLGSRNRHLPVCRRQRHRRDRAGALTDCGAGSGCRRHRGARRRRPRRSRRSRRKSGRFVRCAAGGDQRDDNRQKDESRCGSGHEGLQPVGLRRGLRTPIAYPMAASQARPPPPLFTCNPPHPPGSPVFPGGACRPSARRIGDRLSRMALAGIGTRGWNRSIAS